MNNPEVPVNVDPRLKPESPNGEPVGSFVSPGEEGRTDESHTDPFSLTISRDRLDGIRDDTYFRPVEKDTWFYLFSLLRNASNESIEQHSLGPVSTLQLYRQPDSYRGKLVNVAESSDGHIV